MHDKIAAVMTVTCSGNERSNTTANDVTVLRHRLITTKPSLQESLPE
jgi:hypothetical protein